MDKQVVITQEDINSNKYTFADDVITEHKTGVSRSATVKEEAGGIESQFKARYHYAGVTLQKVQDLADYRLGVNLRASLRGTGRRGHAWIPPKETAVDVFVKDGGKVQIANLPPEVQAKMLFSGIEDEGTRKKAIKAFLASL